MQSSRTTSTTGALSLVENAEPERIRNNAFRVLGLPTNAHPRDVNKRLELLRLSASYGGNGNGGGYVLSLPAGVEEGATTAAGHRLREPSQRLIDELFWFWSPAGDPGMESLRAGNRDAARDAWTRAARDARPSLNAVHDLAVLHLTSAVDCDLARLAETRNTDGGDEKWAAAAARDTHWAQAIARWHQTTCMPEFWSHVGARMRALDDPQLTTAAAERLRAELPTALLLVLARVALRYAEAGDPAQAASLRARMHWPEQKGAHASETVVKDALQRAIAPLRSRLIAMTKPSVQSAEANPSEGLGKAKQLLDATRPLLATVDVLLEKADPILIGVHDDVAGSIHKCLLQNVYERVKKPEPLTQVEFWKETIAVADVLLGLAASASTRETLTADKATYERNAKFASEALVYTTCWFCSAEPRVDAVNAEIKLYGEVVRTPIYNGSNITWKKVTISVPRCRGCQSAHAASTTAQGFGCGMGIFAGIGAGIWAASNNMDGGSVVVGIVVALVGWGIGAAVGSSKHPTNVKPESYGKEFPAVQKLLSEGWTFGDGPSQ